MIRNAVSLVPWGLRRHVKRVPGVAHLQRWVLARTLDGTEFEHQVDAGPARGVTFHIRMPEDKGIWTGAYEIEFAERLAAAVKPGAIAYDIGGWHGFFSAVMANSGAERVYVFEPLPDNIARIRQMVSLNPKLPIELKEMALGAEDGETELVVMPDTSMAKLASSRFQPEALGTRRIKAKVRSIDSLVASGELTPPDLMKIDVEGAEMMVLRGAETVLKTHRPVLFAEVHSPELMDEASALLGGLGYKINILEREEHRQVFQIHAAPQ